jgi:predicted RNase H-like nuclease (RuvC/YqgF family)
MKKYSSTNNDISRIGWEDLITRDKNQPESFKHLNSCLSVEKRESFDDTNKTINKLNDEIIVLKRKLKIAQEKQSEIDKLTKENQQLYKEIESINKKTDITYQLEKENKELKNKLESSDIDNELKKENLVLKRELYQLKNSENIPEETIEFGVRVEQKFPIEIHKLNKKFNPKVVQLVLEKFNLNDNDMITKDIFKKVIKEMI